MHALRQIHEALAPEGVLLDMHPVPPSTRAEVNGEVLGDFDDAAFMATVAAAEAVIEGSGLFVNESETYFDYRERYEDAATLIQEVEDDWEGCKIPDELRVRMLALDGSVDLWERVVLRRFSRSRG